MIWVYSGTEAEANNPNYVEIVMHADGPLQPGETLWREEPFRCLPIDTLQGSDLHVRFTVVGWAGRDHVTTKRSFVFLPLRQAVLEITGEPDVEAFASGDRFNYPVTVKNTGNAPIEDCVLVSQIIPADGEAMEGEYPLLEGGATLWPGRHRDLPWYYEPDGFEGDSITLRVAVSGKNADTGETVSAEWTRTLPRVESQTGSPLFIETGMDEKPFEAGETACVYVTMRNDGEEPLGAIDLSVFISHPDDPTAEVTHQYMGNWAEGLAPGEEIIPIYNYEVTDKDVTHGRILLKFWAHADATADSDPKDGRTTQEVLTKDSTLMYTMPNGKGGGAEDAALFLSGWVDVEGYDVDDALTFQMELQNSGERALTQLSANALLLDENGNKLLDNEIAGWLDWDFQPDDTLPFSWGYVLSEDDVARGYVRALIIAYGQDAETYEHVFTEYGVTVYLTPFAGDAPGTEDGEEGDGPPLKITKRVVGSSEFIEGYHLFEYVNYEITVTNQSPDGVCLTLYDECAGCTPDTLGTRWLLPEESATFPYAFEVGKGEVVAGEIVNEAYAVVTQITEESTAFSVGETYYAAPVKVPTTYRQPVPQERPDEYRVEVRKNVLGKPENGDAYRLGEEIYFEIIVTNPTGNTINSAWIFDELSGCADQPEYLGRLTLGFGQSVTLNYTHTVTEQDVAAGQVENKAWALLAIINEEGDVEDAIFESDVVTVKTTDAPLEAIAPPTTVPPETTKPETRPEPTPAASETSDADFCQRRLIEWGEGISQFELIGCAEHRQALEAFAGALAAADGSSFPLLQWQATKGLLTAAVNEEYDRLGDMLPDEAGKALLAADRDGFFAQLEALEALLASTAEPVAAARLVSEQLAENLIDLCRARHTAPDAPADSLLGREYDRLAGAEDLPDGCQREYSHSAEGQPLTRAEKLCPRHAALDRRLNAAISVTGTNAAALKAFLRAQKDWEAALRRLGHVLARTADKEAQAVITADLFAFHNWQIAREALLAQLYSENRATAAEIVTQTIRRRVIGMESALMQP